MTATFEMLKQRFDCNLEIQSRDFHIELKRLLSGGEEINAHKCLAQLWGLQIISADLSCIALGCFILFVLCFWLGYIERKVNI